jgi:hypothetical protein
MMRWYPVAAAMRDITAVWVCVTRARAERTGRRAYRAADHRARRSATAPAGNRTDSGARSGAYQPAALVLRSKLHHPSAIYYPRLPALFRSKESCFASTQSVGNCCSLVRAVFLSQNFQHRIKAEDVGMHPETRYYPFRRIGKDTVDVALCNATDVHPRTATPPP